MVGLDWSDSELRLVFMASVVGVTSVTATQTTPNPSGVNGSLLSDAPLGEESFRESSIICERG
jgi:hypothetical protein